MSRFFFPCPQNSCHFPAHSPGFLLSNSCHSQCTFAFGSKSLIVKLLGSLFWQLVLEHFLSPKKGRLGGETSKKGLPYVLQCFTPQGIYASSLKATETIWQDPCYYTCHFKVPPKAKCDQQLLLWSSAPLGSLSRATESTASSCAAGGQRAARHPSFVHKGIYARVVLHGVRCNTRRHSPVKGGGGGRKKNFITEVEAWNALNTHRSKEKEQRWTRMPSTEQRSMVHEHRIYLPSHSAASGVVSEQSGVFRRTVTTQSHTPTQALFFLWAKEEKV